MGIHMTIKCSQIKGCIRNAHQYSENYKLSQLAHFRKYHYQYRFRFYSITHLDLRYAWITWIKIMANADATPNNESFAAKMLSELVGSPLNIGLLVVCGILLYKIFAGRRTSPPPPRKPELPKMKKRDFTLEQLKEYDGRGSDERILIAVNGKVFDVTRGKRFYGPGKVVRGNSKNYCIKHFERMAQRATKLD